MTFGKGKAKTFKNLEPAELISECPEFVDQSSEENRMFAHIEQKTDQDSVESANIFSTFVNVNKLDEDDSLHIKKNQARKPPMRLKTEHEMIVKNMNKNAEKK